jgi:hypothetical protein
LNTRGFHRQDESWGAIHGRASGDFAGDLRRFAIDAHRILRRPESPVDEVFALHARAWSLLQEAPGARSGEIRRWLLAARRAIGVRLQSWASEEMESLVA